MHKQISSTPRASAVSATTPDQLFCGNCKRMVIGWRDVCQQEPVICPCGNWSMRAQIEKDIQDHAATLVADYAFDQLMPSHSSSFYVAESAFIFAF